VQPGTFIGFNVQHVQQTPNTVAARIKCLPLPLIPLWVQTIHHFILLNGLQPPIPRKIYTLHEAKFLLQSVYDLWAACETDASIAQSQLKDAIAESTCAEHHLRQAELRAGQVRSAIRQNGFEHLLLSSSLFPATNTSGEHQTPTTCAIPDGCRAESWVDISQAMALVNLD
jgi:hypothetical protein